ncbi:hypothetical protein FJZ22_03185 [Candidatus Pacearchaeota archaeon]|nr:hypothetical protein [Candidatus Pacearchaeota archaeon]
MVLDLSGLDYLLPIWLFLLVFIISFAVLVSTKIVGENKFWLVFVAFVLATLFITAASARDYVESTAPWAIVVLMVAFFILLVTGFIGEPAKALKGSVGVGLVVVLLLVFLFAALRMFGDSLSPSTTRDPLLLWLYSGPVAGIVILLAVCGLVGWVLTKK